MKSFDRIPGRFRSLSYHLLCCGIISPVNSKLIVIVYSVSLLYFFDIS